MTIQFPANPPLNDTFDYEGKTYIWDGEKWTASASSPTSTNNAAYATDLALDAEL